MKTKKSIRSLFVFFSLFCVIIPVSAFAQAAATPDDATAGANAQYTIAFFLDGLDNLPANGSITLEFNAGFTLGGTMTATSPDIDGNFNNATPVGQTVTFVRDGSGTDLSGGTQHTIVVQTVTNNTTTGNYTIRLTTNGSTDITTDPFTITPAALGSFTITGEPASATAGTAFSTPANDIVVTAFDAFGNPKTNYTGTVVWSSSDGNATLPSSGLTFSGASKTFLGSAFTLRTTGTQTLTVADGLVNETSDNITVNPGALGSFTITGEPASATAGTAFSTPANDIVVTAFDAFGNLKTNYTGTVSWSSTDGNATLPSSGLTFSGASKTFLGSSFTLRTTGTRTITVTDGGVSRTSTNITVNPGALASFTLSGEPASATAGTAFSTPANDIVVTAFDAFGNLKTNYTGTVTWTSSDGNATLPSSGLTFSGASKTFLGSAFTLRTAGNQTIRVADGLINRDSNPITVNAAAIASFVLNNPATQEAGVPFSLQVSNAADVFSNPASGTVTVTFQDGQSHQVPNGESPTLANITVTGGGGFANQTLVLRENNVVLSAVGGTGNDVTAPFNVNAGPIENFSLSDPGSQTAGTAFTLSVENARDGFNNVADGTVTITFTDGQAHLAPNATAPTLNQITVTSGSGNAQQTLVKAESGVQLHGQSGTASDNTAAFTVVAGSISTFTVDNPGTRTAGVPFSLSISGAQDARGNAASGSVAISFTDGQAHLAPNGIPPVLQDITVTNGTGSKNQTWVLAESNVQMQGNSSGVIRNSTAFTVNAGTLNAIQIQTDASGKTSEFTTAALTVGDQTTIHAVGFDVYQNFAGDLSVNWSIVGTNIGTLTPASGISTVFQATTVGTGLIQANHTGSGLSDFTGAIQVNVGAVDNIKIRDAANGGGNEVGNVTIKADSTLTLFAAGYSGTNFWGNISVNWTAASGNLAPPVSSTGASFTFSPTTAPTSGVIRATHVASGKTDDTGLITVNVGNLNRVKVLTGNSLNTAEVGDQSLQPSDQLVVHAGGFDSDNNYINDQSNINWSVSGGIGTMTPASGVTSTFMATTQGNGNIKADHPTAIDGFSGQITVGTGSVDSVDIRTQPGNGGVSFSTYTMTTDDSVTVYAAGYNSQNTFVQDVPVTWRTNGTLPASGNPQGTSFKFKPGTPGLGKIIADHATVTVRDDTTGNVRVKTGVPVGAVTLTPAQTTLPANGTATTQITSSVIKDAHNNNVGANRFFTASITPSNLGTIVGGNSIKTNANSQLVFTFQSSTVSGPALVRVESDSGNAEGQTTITTGSIRITSIFTSPQTVSRGQANILVTMVVQNLSTQPITNLVADLKFTDTIPQDRTGEYTRVRTDGNTGIPGSGQVNLTFNVGVAANATIGAITISGTASGQIGATPVSADPPTNTDSWTVQVPAQIQVVSVVTAPDTVVQGQQDVNVAVTLRNTAPAGGAIAAIDNVQLKFLYQGIGDSASFFPVGPNGANPKSVNAQGQAVFNFIVDITAPAPIGNYTLDAGVTAHDSNYAVITLSDQSATSPDQWYVKAASNLQIVSLTPFPTATVRSGQTTDWFVKMAVANNGPDNITVNFSQSAIQFFIGGNNKTSEYTFVKPSALVISGNNNLVSGSTDTLVFRIDVTGTTPGTAGISGTIRGTDTGSNEPISDETSISEFGSVQITPNATVTIRNTVPHSTLPNKGLTEARVNTNQSFQITVEVENSLVEPVEEVVLMMTSNGSSTIIAPSDTLAIIPATSTATINFDVTAASVSDAIDGETFTVAILSARGQLSQQPALIGNPVPGNDDVLFYIQTPAELEVHFVDLEKFQTAGDTFSVVARIQNDGQGGYDNSGRLTLILPDVYNIFSSPNPAVLPQPDNPTTEWRVIAPGNDTAEEDFIVNISTVPRALNTGDFAAVAVVADTQIVQTLATGLTINSFRIIDPTGATDNIISTGQRFTVRAEVTISQTINKVMAELLEPEGYQILPQFQNPRTVIPNQGQTAITVDWQVDGALIPHQARTFTVSMKAFTGETERADTTSTFNIVAVSRASIDLDSFTSSIGQRASFEQPFELRAMVLNRGAADVEGAAKLTLNLANTGIISQESLVRDFTPGTEIIWHVTAPDSVSALKTITVRMDPVPNDENTNSIAFHDPERVERSLQIETGEVGSVSVDLTVATPGAIDGIISTEQKFRLNASVMWENVVQGQVELILPQAQGYTTDNANPVALSGADGNGTFFWDITTPIGETSPLQLYLKAEVTGKDLSDQTKEVPTARDSLAFTVVPKALLRLDALISEPESAKDSVLTVGQEFTITARLIKSGSAGVSNSDSFEVSLPTGYRLASGETELKGIAAGGQGSWKILAPQAAHDNLRNIVVQMFKRGTIEENTRANPPLSPTSRTISVTTRAISLETTVLTDERPATIPLGAQNQPLFGLRFTNDSDANIEVNKIDLRVRNKDGGEIPPNSVLSRVEIVDYENPNRSIGVLSSLPAQNPIDFNFTDQITVVKGGGKQAILFRVNILDQTEVAQFQIQIDAANKDIVARVVNADTVAITDNQGIPLALIAPGISVIKSADFKAGFFNYPNPFGDNSKPLTSFSYNIAQATDVTIRIYTLFGRPVKVIERANVQPGNYDGSNGALDWDGTNDNGDKVLNGVYIAVMTTSAGTAVTKVAVAR